MRDGSSLISIIINYGLAILLAIIATIAPVSIEIKYAIVAIALAFLSLGWAILLSGETKQLLKNHFDEVKKQLSELKSELEKLKK